MMLNGLLPCTAAWEPSYDPNPPCPPPQLVGTVVGTVVGPGQCMSSVRVAGCFGWVAGWSEAGSAACAHKQARPEAGRLRQGKGSGNTWARERAAVLQSTTQGRAG